MIFASTDLVRSIELAECRLLTDAAEAIQQRQPDRDVLVEPIAGGVATFTGADSPLTKVAGLGFAGPLDEAAIVWIERHWASRGAAVQVELSSLADPSIAALLTDRGYVLRGFENVLGLALVDGDAVGGGTAAAEDEFGVETAFSQRVVQCGDFEITVSDVNELALWTDVAVTAFAAPDTESAAPHEIFSHEALARDLRDMAGASGLTRYLVRRDAAPVAIASMKVSEGIAQLCGAATLPAHRRHGAQHALLLTRLAAAQRTGCGLATVVTLPGSRSHANVQRKGFELLYTRAILVRPVD